MKKTKIPAVKVQADGDAAFSEAMKDVRTIDRLKRRRIEKRRPKQLKHHNEDDAKRILEKTVTGDYPFNVVNMPEYMEGHIEGINPVVMEKLRNG